MTSPYQPLPGLEDDPDHPDTALERWLRADREYPAEAPDADPGPEGGRELARLRSQLALIKARAELMRDPGWLDEPTPSEQAADRDAAARIRAMRRSQSLAAAIAEDELHARARHIDTRMARLELSDRLWSRRALARRRRLLDPTSRLAGLHRTHIASSAVLIGVAIAGIAWTSVGHDALVGPDGTALAYVVEPLFSLPLLVIMAISAQAAQWKQTFPPPDQRGRVYGLEAFLLISTIAMNTVSVLPGIGTWHNVATLLAHLVPPMLIVVAVILQPLIAGFLAGILTTSADTEPEHGTPQRLSLETATTLRLISRVHEAIDRGDLPEWSNTGLPSISAIQRHLRCEKRRAQLVYDALRMLHRTRDGSTRRAHGVPAGPALATGPIEEALR